MIALLALVAEVSLLGLFATPVYGTWSVIATDRATGQVGGAGATCRIDDKDDTFFVRQFGWAPNVGSLVGQGLTRAFEVQNAEDLLESCTLGVPDEDEGCADKVFKEVPKGGDLSQYQWGMVDLFGEKPSFTGYGLEKAFNESGNVSGIVDGFYTYSVQGSRLTKGVIENVENEFRKKVGKGGRKKCDDLADRLIRGLEAGMEDDGGDNRCQLTTLDGSPQNWAEYIPATTAYLLVSDYKEDPITADKRKVVVYCLAPTKIDKVPNTHMKTGRDALKALRCAYDEWRKEHSCMKRPREPRFDPLPEYWDTNSEAELDDEAESYRRVDCKKIDLVNVTCVDMIPEDVDIECETPHCWDDN